MITRAALLLTAALLAAGPARASSSPAVYDAKAAPLDDLCKELLTGNGYEIRDDGVVWDKIGEAAVTRDDMPYLLSRLASAKRLRALLEINNIITRYDAERKLTPEDKEAVRQLVRANWVVFGVAPRNDFRSYFSVEELETLDKIPSRFDTMSAITMTDPPIDSVTENPPSVTALPPAAVAAAPVAAAPAPVAPPAAPQAAAPAAAAVAAVPARVIPTLTPLMEPPSLKRESPFASAPAPAPAPAPALPVAAPVVAASPAPAAVAPPPAPVAAAALPAAPVAPAAVIPAAPVTAAPVVYTAAPSAPIAAGPAPIAFGAHPAAPAATFRVEAPAPPAVPVVYAAPVAPPVAAVVAAGLGTLKVWTPPAGAAAPPRVAPKAPVVAVAKPAAPVAAAPPPPEPPKIAAVSEAEYEKFIAEGPYNSGGKAVLELLGKRAPEFCLPLLRRTVVGAIPQIVSDGARTGAELRAGFTVDAANPLAPPLIALSPGPVFVVVKQGMFGGREAVLVPESTKAWADLGVSRPRLDALREDASPVSTENGDWGATRLYADGSRRGSYSTTEMAGEMLEQLLLLGLAREGLDASPYAARQWARTARLMFYARLKEETQQDNFLDPDRRAELRGWLDHPDESEDLTAAVWSGSRVQLLDPRRGPPAAALDFETRQRDSCVRSALEDALAENARRGAARVGELSTLADAGLVDSGAAKTAARAAADEEANKRLALIVRPPACPPANPAREEGLRKASLLLTEATRAERLLREHRAGIENHAL
ncbi:MAG TPA: hypothetical protein VN915_06355 [Elusimicrobiota bacterium]|nr:hypothetical protein [Elusimicrobiota bacterium]